MISRLKKLEEKKIIQGYTVRLNHSALGYDITGIIEVTTTKGKMVEIEDEIAKTENVCAVYDITGNADIMVIGKFKDRTSLSEFVKKISSIPNVENTITHLVLNTVKEDSRFI
jgi:DNA-binding Lrp family transcriptional regulator